MKRIVLSLIILFIAGAAFAGPEVQLSKGLEPQYFDLRMGIGYSMDSHQNDEDVIVYVQTPIFDLRFLWVNFGFVFPVDFEINGRSPLAVALTTSLDQWIRCPVFLNWEIGAFFVPQLESWGFQLGLVNIRF